MKVSFDFDNTLSLENVQQYAKELIDKGIIVYIVTARQPIVGAYEYAGYIFDNLALFAIADKLGIKRENIFFCSGNLKANYFLEHPEFIWHLDDDLNEIISIGRHTKVHGIQVGVDDWMDKCDELINKYLC